MNSYNCVIAVSSISFLSNNFGNCMGKCFLQTWKRRYRWKHFAFIPAVTVRKRWLASKQYAKHNTFGLSHLFFCPLFFFLYHNTSPLQTTPPNVVRWPLSAMLCEIIFCEPASCTIAQACFSKNTVLLFRYLIFTVEFVLGLILRNPWSPKERWIHLIFLSEKLCSVAQISYVNLGICEVM